MKMSFTRVQKKSDVYRRQILTYKDGPCTERVISWYIDYFSIIISDYGFF